jgi:hypothetical protein
MTTIDVYVYKKHIGSNFAYVHGKHIPIAQDKIQKLSEKQAQRILDNVPHEIIADDVEFEVLED